MWWCLWLVGSGGGGGCGVEAVVMINAVALMVGWLVVVVAVAVRKKTREPDVLCQD